MSPIDYALKPLRRYADFSGRASRPEYWWYVLLLIVAVIVAMILDNLAGTERMAGPYGLVALAVLVATVIPSLAAATRRLHDTGKSGWWQLIMYLPYVVLIVLMGRSAMDMAAGTSDPTTIMLIGVLSLVTLVTAILLIVWLAKRGDSGDNRFGPPASVD